jgi:diguanylate cyclase (GGDEF)-like protein
MDREEQILHEFAEALQFAETPEIIVNSFLSAVRSITGLDSISWIRDPHHDAPKYRPVAKHDRHGEARVACASGISEAGDQAEPLGLELVIRAGGRFQGRLRLMDSKGRKAEIPSATMMRLRTLSTLTASDLQRLEGKDDGGAWVPSIQARAPDGASGEDHGRCAGPEEEFHDGVPIVQDATFLNAVLPFAVGQAKRHGESIALLCVAIDRLDGIRELMGRQCADRTVGAVGRHVAAMIRGSDIVARIDDDRIIAVLPRADLDGACRVAEGICRRVGTSCVQPLGLPSLTVSIGVAELPKCADTVYGLLDATDHALLEAQKSGRNRWISAGPRDDSVAGRQPGPTSP